MNKFQMTLAVPASGYISKIGAKKCGTDETPIVL